ncbi:hypothetical protein PRZ48_007898 [Zasmidium cellare]|uniref:S-adenosyl-L-methionine-dependent methyltransferase n=1 Tax=Zasmidium cellare TaxID=395010 RepID=A0ABR0EKQ2_ZASCE|nr:hypothetical protein PRZ48_007898 [Zasmidium cellare]
MDYNVLFPRFHLAEIEDQPWCPELLRTNTHKFLARFWKASTSNKGSPALQACQILVRELGGLTKASEYTFVDSCAGAGGPTPIIEPILNEQLRSTGHNTVQFKLTDLWPDLKAWKEVASQHKNISFVEFPVDATKAIRLSGDNKECRMYNLCFHHFDDPAAEKVLLSAVESSDAFFIFEMTHRTAPSLLNTFIINWQPFFTTIYDWWWSPLHLIFVYLIPLIPILTAWDGLVSCIRGRTADETWDLLTKSSGLSVEEWQQKHGWELRSGREVVLPPFGTMYWCAGIKKPN